MPGGLAATFELLTNTDNDAAVAVLVPALDSPDPAIQEAALVAILRRRTVAGGREILDRMPRMKPEWKAAIRQHHGRMSSTLRNALLGADPGLCENACRAAVMFQDYDLIPTLLTSLDDPNRPHAATAGQSVFELVQALYEELAGNRDPQVRRDPQMVRRYVVNALEQSVLRYGQHRRREVIESFLLLASRENVTLKQILQNPHHAAFLTMIDILTKSPQGGVIRLLIGFLDDPFAPSAALSVVANRCDTRYLNHLLRKIGRDPTGPVAQNLKRMEIISWLDNCRRLITAIDVEVQHALVRLVMLASIPRQQAFATIDTVLRNGNADGRREAARALAEFQGAEANALAMFGLADKDPQVQANIVVQLRGRGIPGALPSLLSLLESPHEVVRRAARDSLSEFNFRRFAAAFDMLDEAVRQSTGKLVRKIDPEAIPLAREELRSPIRTRRLRGLAIVQALESLADLEAEVVLLLADDDHIVRTEAAMVLGQLSTPGSREALESALSDTSEAVRQAAQRSLEEIKSRRSAR